MWGQILGSGRQGHNLAGESPVISICSFRICSDVTVHGKLRAIEAGNPMFIADNFGPGLVLRVPFASVMLEGMVRPLRVE